MWKTAFALLVTIVVVPVIAFRYDDPLTTIQSATLTQLAVIYLAAALLCFIVSSLTRNYSQVDKLWSIMPVIYVWVVVFYADFEPRIVLMAILVSAWGIRLSFNFGRRGGYSIRFWSGEEDYRWAVLRSKPEFKASWKWVLFNLFFISLYQMGLILLMTLPTVRGMGERPLTVMDWILAGILVGLIVTETVADQQQWEFHKKKQRLKETGADLHEPFSLGFVHHGLWGLVRHPNYTAEQAIWITFYFFSVTASGRWVNWSVMGAILLVLLFLGSSNFSEAISAGKYPGYDSYRKRVPRFIPFTK